MEKEFTYPRLRKLKIIYLFNCIDHGNSFVWKRIIHLLENACQLAITLPFQKWDIIVTTIYKDSDWYSVKNK